MRLLTLGVSLSLLMTLVASAKDAEWSGWRGPNRDGKSAETGLLKEWPEDGPKLVWKAEGLGAGFSSPAIADGRIYITGDVEGKLVLFAFDLEGKQLWQREHGRGRGGPEGSRASPVVDGDFVYLLGGHGLLGCYDRRNGEPKWTLEAKTLGGRPGGWGYAESVLIYQDKAIFKPGGKSCIVAANKLNGEVIWKSSGFDAGPEYGSCIVVDFEGTTMIVTGTGGGLVAVDAKDGTLLWKNEFSAHNTANCPTPAYADGYVFWANGYGKGGVCVKLKKQDGKVAADEAWTTNDMVCHHGGYIIHEGHIYGNHSGGWSCLDLKTGDKKWNERAVGKGSLCFADGMLYLFSESRGRGALGACSPEKLDIKGKVQVEGSGPSWAHPVVSGGRLYLRYDRNLYCFDVKKT